MNIRARFFFAFVFLFNLGMSSSHAQLRRQACVAGKKEGVITIKELLDADSLTVANGAPFLVTSFKFMMFGKGNTYREFQCPTNKFIPKMRDAINTSAHDFVSCTISFEDITYTDIDTRTTHGRMPPFSLDLVPDK